MDKIRIRKAKKSDTGKLLKLVFELAKYENLTSPDSAAVKRLIKDGFSKDPKFNVSLAEFNNKIAGYAIYFFTYSSFLAKRTLYLEDIFIREKFRNKGIGKFFFEKLLREAKKNKCGRMEWVVLDWNESAIKFYEKLGASHLKEWMTFRISL